MKAPQLHHPANHLATAFGFFFFLINLTFEFNWTALKVLAQNFPGQPLTAPNFEEFSMPMNTTSAPEPLHPNQPILDSEIQQIAPE